MGWALWKRTAVTVLCARVSFSSSSHSPSGSGISTLTGVPTAAVLSWGCVTPEVTYRLCARGWRWGGGCHVGPYAQSIACLLIWQSLWTIYWLTRTFYWLLWMKRLFWNFMCVRLPFISQFISTVRPHQFWQFPTWLGTSPECTRRSWFAVYLARFVFSNHKLCINHGVRIRLVSKSEVHRSQTLRKPVFRPISDVCKPYKWDSRWFRPEQTIEDVRADWLCVGISIVDISCCGGFYLDGDYELEPLISITFLLDQLPN